MFTLSAVTVLHMHPPAANWRWTASIGLVGSMDGKGSVQ
jgi:hypothetical protein